MGAGFATDSPPCYERPVTLGGSLSRPDPFGSNQNLPDRQPFCYPSVIPWLLTVRPAPLTNHPTAV